MDAVILDHDHHTLIEPLTVSNPHSHPPGLANPTHPNLFPIPFDTSGGITSMAGMARHGSVAAYSGFSVCQPALGAALQWLPAIGTPELDDMINTFLPGPASIQDKRAHISMDFFEYSRQTGENFKFYPVPSGSFTPVAASPASYTSAFNQSPVLSDQGSWTPVTFAPSPVDVRSKPRASVSKKSSASSSRQSTNDFANHPGMRILTKDGRDVTNSASRGCKTKEQRDHAHLMRIIKACDSCRKKKVRCDPSHRKRNASQASPSQAEQKPAKKARKVEESPPVAVVGSADDFLVAGAFDAPETTLSFPSLETAYPPEFEEFWNDFISFDQEPAAIAPQTSDDFLFDSFTDSANYFSPSSGSSSTSPSQVFTPTTSVVSRTSPSLSSDVAVDVAGDAEGSLLDPTVPYLNPGVAHGTNYVDFNLFSPGPDVFDEDPVLQMRDLASEQQQHVPASTTASPVVLGAGVIGLSAALALQSHSPRHSPAPQRLASAAVSPTTNVVDSSTDMSWFDPGSTVYDALIDVRHTSHMNGGEAGGSVAFDPSPGEPYVPQDYGQEYRSPWANAVSTVSAGIRESSVSLGTAPGRRVTTTTTHTTASSTTVLSGGVNHTGVVESLARYLPVASPNATHAASPAALDQSHKAAGDTVSASPIQPSRHRQSCVNTLSSVPTGLSTTTTTGLGLGHATRSSLAQPDGQRALSVVQNGAPVLGGLGAVVTTTTLNPTLPARRNVAVEVEVSKSSSSFFSFQLAVFGLVSIILCACAPAALQQQARLESSSQSLSSSSPLVGSLVNILLITMSLSLARSASPSSWWWAAGSPPLPSSQSSPSLSCSLSKPSGIIDSVGAKIQRVVSQSMVRRRAVGSLHSRSLLLPSAARLIHVQ